jgi:hypothetical protein
MSNFRNLMQIFAECSPAADPHLAGLRDSILAPFARQSELRFFVDGTANCGHQAATVHVIRRLIAITRFSGRITVVYADILPGGSLGRTPDKLALLMPGLDPRCIETAVVGWGTCREIRFLNFSRRADLAEEVDFGFTAGADDMNINFARELKVKRFLRLQPYLWDDDASKKGERFYESSRIETAADEFFYPVDDYPPFRSIPYKYASEECESVDESIWNWYARKQTFDSALRIRTEKLREWCNARNSEPGLILWPVYGLHHFRNFLPQILKNLRFATSQFTRKIKLILLNSVDEIEDEDAVGPVPGDFYNYLYANGGMPGVFEGQNTSSLVISLGRPFLQLQRASSGIGNSYPQTIGRRNFAEIATRANAAAMSLLCDASETIRFIEEALDPASAVAEYFQAMAAYYQDDLHDKLFAGLLALTLSL